MSPFLARGVYEPSDGCGLCGEESRNSHLSPAWTCDSRQRSIRSVQKRSCSAGPSGGDVVVQFRKAASSKMISFLGLMIEPTTQFIGRCDFSKAKIDLGPVFVQTTRPKPVDKNPHAVISRCRFMDSLEGYLHPRQCFASHFRCCCKSLRCLRAHPAKCEKRTTLRPAITNLSL